MPFAEVEMIKELFATAAGLLAMPAMVLHICATKESKKTRLYLLDAVVLTLLLISLLY